MISKLSLVAMLLLCSIGFLGGCAGMKKSDSMSSSNPKDNLVVVTGSHGATATFGFDQGSGKAKMMSSTGDMKSCPACMADVDKYYSTGMMDPVCKECGAKRSVVSAAKTGGHGMY